MLWYNTMISYIVVWHHTTISYYDIIYCSVMSCYNIIEQLYPLDEELYLLVITNGYNGSMISYYNITHDIILWYHTVISHIWGRPKAQCYPFDSTRLWPWQHFMTSHYDIMYDITLWHHAIVFMISYYDITPMTTSAMPRAMPQAHLWHHQLQ